MRRRHEVVKRPATIRDPLYVTIGIGAILFPLCHLLSFLSVSSVSLASLLLVVAYAVLVPVAYLLYQELRATSPILSIIAALFGVVPVVAVTLALLDLLKAVISLFGIVPIPMTFFGNDLWNLLLVMTILFSSMTLWIGLSGYLAFSHKLLSRNWAIWSMGIGALSLLLEVFILIDFTFNLETINAGSLFSILLVLLPVSVVPWTVWTGVMIIRQGSFANEE